MRETENRGGNINYVSREALGKPLYQVVRATHVKEPHMNGSQPTEQKVHAGVTLELPGRYYLSGEFEGEDVASAYLGAVQRAVGEGYSEAKNIKTARLTAHSDERGRTEWGVQTEANGVIVHSVMNGNVAPVPEDMTYWRDPVGLAVSEAVHDSLRHQIRHSQPEKQEPNGRTIFVVK